MQLAVPFPDVVVERDTIARARGKFLRGPLIEQDAGGCTLPEEAIVGGDERIWNLARAYTNGVGEVGEDRLGFESRLLRGGENGRGQVVAHNIAGRFERSTAARIERPQRQSQIFERISFAQHCLDGRSCWLARYEDRVHFSRL